MNCGYKFRLLKAGAVLLVAISAVSVAQDRRVVVEPAIPSVCAVLDAMLSMHGGILNAKDETKLDTTRVERALDSCGTGKAVQLGSKGIANTFLIGPIAVPRGVILLVDRGVTVISSRDPRLYDVHPDSCGVVNDQPSTCKAAISGAHAAVRVL